MIITIDGPVASGKTTVGKLVAAKLGFDYLYSGFLYRAVVYVLLKNDYCTTEQLSTVNVGFVEKIIARHQITYHFLEHGDACVLVEGICVDEQVLMVPEIDKASSMLGLNMHMRELLTEIQRSLVKDRNVVVDGRDAGSVVFPQADFKFFLTACVTIRAKRYAQRQKKQGNSFTLEEAEHILTERDNRDQKILTAANTPEDILVIDTTNMSQEEVVNFIIACSLQSIVK